VIPPGRHRGHVVERLALDLLARRARVAARLPGGHPLETPVERQQPALDAAANALSRAAWDAAGVADLDLLRDRMRRFAEDRDWGRYHDPKSVLLALVGEVGELAELFQWLPATRARDLARDEPLRTRAGEEMADVLLYLVLLADVLDIDLAVAAQAKMDDSERRYPPGRDPS
jgi:dCTP diphosphatase